MTEIQIPFHKRAVLGKELDYVRHAIQYGKVSGDGHFTRLCHDLLKKQTGAQGVLLTTSCTHALEMAALLLDIQPGDEVILASFSAVSTANAFILRGARPVFLDSRSDTLNLDENQIEARITPRTKAIVPVHYAGVACEMDRILKLARAHGIAVVEDNAHGLFGRYHGRPLGSFGSLATQSFHETKNITCGKGGALLINDPQLVHRAEVLRRKGITRESVHGEHGDTYTWVDAGSSWAPSDVLAALLLAQLEEFEKVQNARQRLWLRYNRELADWATDHDVWLPEIPAECEQAYHMFYLLMPSLEDRQGLIQHLAESGITATFHYVPLHLTPMGEKFGGRRGDFPVVEALSDRLVRLPFYFDLSDEQQWRVIEAVRAFRPDGGRSVTKLQQALSEHAPARETIVR
jgi:dTDP-4-amino-4,6-dideoxygalactose transaminase